MSSISFYFDDQHGWAQAQKTEFYRLMEEHVISLDQLQQAAFCITQEKYGKAIAAFQLKKGLKCNEGSHFKFWHANTLSCKKSVSEWFNTVRKRLNLTKEEPFDTIEWYVKKRIATYNGLSWLNLYFLCTLNSVI